MKECRTCGIEKQDSDFRKHHRSCRTCCYEKYNKHRPGKRDSRLKHLYGITEDQYEQMFAEQDGRCAICCCEQPEKKLAVDHNHHTGQVRGLLCSDCNRGIGLLKDNALHLLAAYHYLNNNDRSTTEVEPSQAELG